VDGCKKRLAVYACVPGSRKSKVDRVILHL
jgi:hypothetical protein